MPVSLSERDGKYCVVEPSGKIIHCHETREDALAQLRAINANLDKESPVSADIEQVEKAVTAYVDNMADEARRAAELKSYTYTSVDNSVPTWVVLGEPDMTTKEFNGIMPTTFGELKEVEEEYEADQKLTGLVYDFMNLAGNVIALGGDKQAGLHKLASELTSLLKGEEEASKEAGLSENITVTNNLMVEARPKIKADVKLTGNGFYVWKQEDGTWRWMGVYSNKFRDDDRPVSEILSEKSHVEFISRVTKGEIGYPDLYVWHIPVPVGKADLLAYDDSGFSVALGYFNNKSHRIARALQKTKIDLAMSHGMPSEFIERDKDDPTVITRYVSTEVSVLSRDAAANKMTSFSIIKAKEDENMSIAPELRDQVVQMLGEEATADLEGQLAAQADKAIDDGVEFKEAGEEAVADTQPVAEQAAEETTQEPVAEAISEPEEKIVDKKAPPPFAEEEDEEEEDEEKSEVSDESAEETSKVTADADAPIVTALKEELTGVLAEIVKAVDANTKAIGERLDALETKVSELEKDENDKLTEKAAGMTTASIASLLARQFTGEQATSVIGQSATHVHGNSALAKDGPAEVSPDESDEQMGLFFQKWTSGKQS